MSFTEAIGSATINGVAYIGGLARLAGGSLRAIFVEPFHGKKFHISRSVHQAMAVGVEALPIVSLISPPTNFVSLARSRSWPAP
jgi:ABC-type transporter Mla maintaining outer membrane lipid asymmetry permease subunit MlaE